MTKTAEATKPLDPIPHVPVGEEGRTGKVFCLRVDDNERARLADLHKMAEPIMPWRPDRRRSLGAFMVWAALQWKPAQLPLAPKAKPKKPRAARGRVIPGRRRGGKPGRRAAKKKGRRS